MGAVSLVRAGSGDALVLSHRSADAIEPTEALVLDARNGSRAAFGRLYEIHVRMAHGILLARVPRIEVDDLVQEVFLLAMRRLGTLREPAAFGGWLAVIARNRANDFHRGTRETEELSEASGSGGTHAVTNDPAHAEALAALAAIRELPEAYNETLVLRLVEGMTGPEISARTGLTPASVRVNLHRGMKMLREALGRGSQGSGS